MREAEVKTEPEFLGILTPETHITALRFSPCGKILAGASFDQRVRRWDLRDVTVEVDPKKKVKEYPAPRLPDVVTGHNGFVSTVEFHPSRLLAVSADTWGSIHAWSYLSENPEPIWRLPDAHDGWVRDLAMRPDGEWFVTCGKDGMVRVFATIDGRLLREFDGHEEDVFAVAFHPDNRHIVSADLKGRTLVHDVQTGKPVREFDCADFHLLHRLQDLAGIRQLRFSGDGTQLLVIGTIPTGGANFRGQAHVRIFDFGTGKVAHDLPLGDSTKNAIAHDAGILLEGTVVAVTTGQSGAGNLFLHKPGEEEPRYQLSRGTVNNHSLALSSDQRTLAVAATNTGSNGNGKRLDKEGNYAGNHSPIHVFEMPKAV